MGMARWKRTREGVCGSVLGVIGPRSVQCPPDLLHLVLEDFYDFKLTQGRRCRWTIRQVPVYSAWHHLQSIGRTNEQDAAIHRAKDDGWLGIRCPDFGLTASTLSTCKL